MSDILKKLAAPWTHSTKGYIYNIDENPIGAMGAESAVKAAACAPEALALLWEILETDSVPELQIEALLKKAGVM